MVDYGPKIREVISASSRNNKGDYLKLIFAPWFDNSNNRPILYIKPESITKVAENLAFPAAKDIMNKAIFNNKPSKYWKDTYRRSVNIRIIFNVAKEDQNEIRKQLQ